MRNPHRLSFIVMAVLATGPTSAWAGMPTVQLTDVTRMRVQSISFFLACFLLSAGVIQFLWNRLRVDFAFLPRLTYGKAVVLVSLWGLLFVLVLTMISGARELLTPGAWKKEGFTYQLAKDAPPASDDSLERSRKEKLEALRLALWNYALLHDKRFPSTRDGDDLLAESWQLPQPSGYRYLYVGNQAAGGKPVPLAYEPELYGPKRFVLFTNGEIRSMSSDEISRDLELVKAP